MTCWEYDYESSGYPECCSVVLKKPCVRHSRLANDHEEWRKHFNRTRDVT